MSRNAWIATIAAVALIVGVYAAFMLAGADSPVVGGGQPVAVSTATAEATSAPASAAAPAQPAPAAPSAVDPGVAVTDETGESFCYVTDAFSQGGRRYVVVDYIRLGEDLGMSEDYEIINENPKLRTFEVTGDSYIAAFWMAFELYGEWVMDDWARPGTDQEDWIVGTVLKWDDLVAAADDGTVNDHSYWYARVRNGRIERLVNTYQD